MPELHYVLYILCCMAFWHINSFEFSLCCLEAMQGVVVCYHVAVQYCVCFLATFLPTNLVFGLEASAAAGSNADSSWEAAAVS